MAQESEPRVETRLERDEIYEGESVLYTVLVRNTRDPRPPDLSAFQDFEVRGAGEQSLNSSEVRIINGRVIRKETFGRAYGYLLTPRQGGRLIVPAPTVEVDGKKLKGEPRALRVVAPEAQNLVILDISAVPSEVYPLQPFEVRLRVFVRRLPAPREDRDPTSVIDPAALEVPWADPPADLESASTSDWLSPKLARRQQRGFTINKIARKAGIFEFDDPIAVFDLEGRPAVESDVASIPSLAGRAEEYWVYELVRAFTPRRPGSYRFGPATVKGTFAEELQGRRFSGRKVYAIGKAAHVTVKSVPDEGKPASFTGAIGEFGISVDVAPRKARVGDPMTFTLVVTGRGNLEDVAAPDLTQVPEFASRFKLYEATSETKGERRIFTYSLRPIAAAVTHVPAVPFSYFDVAKERYITIHTEPIEIEIAEAVRMEGGDIVVGGNGPRAGKSVEARLEGIFANITDARQISNDAVNVPGTVGYAGALGVLYLFGAVWVARRRRLREDPALQRRRAAARRARERLDEALRSGDRAQGIRAALVGWVADVAGIPEAGLTAREVSERVREWGAGEALAGRAAALIESCDAWRYGAGAEAPADLDAPARAVLEELTSAFRGKAKS
ncbi:MAG: BatD family protein [Planctomycetes bacterium]|nr:BatD family protein [Planctomycetota bacterium]